LTYLFESLKTHGGSFSTEFWDKVANGVLFPIFDDLKSDREHNKSAGNKEEFSVWLSTTLIQALRMFIELYTCYFERLRFLIDGVLDLLSVCMTQENETLARIGSTCFVQLLEGCAGMMDIGDWDKVGACFVGLFGVTTPSGLFIDEEGKSTLQKKDFHKIIVNCVLHLLIITTLGEVLMSNEKVFKDVPSGSMFQLIDCLEASYSFAVRFNGDVDLRTRLFRMGFMKQMPNLLKQETTSVTGYIGILLKMYGDAGREADREEIFKRLVPLSRDIMTTFVELDPEAKKRNVNSWRPVVVQILEGLAGFEEERFRIIIGRLYGVFVELLRQEVTPDVRVVLHRVLKRCEFAFGTKEVASVENE
jgi:brefeldin A-inhibited guanine nucleotide-exchange protein